MNPLDRRVWYILGPIPESAHHSFVFICQEAQQRQQAITKDVRQTILAPELKSRPKTMLECIAPPPVLDGPDLVQKYMRHEPNKHCNGFEQTQVHVFTRTGQKGEQSCCDARRYAVPHPSMNRVSPKDFSDSKAQEKVDADSDQ